MIVQPGKIYSIIVARDIHISKAVIDFSVPPSTSIEYATSLIVECQGKKIILCHLKDGDMHSKMMQPQADLDIHFSEGQKLAEARVGAWIRSVGFVTLCSNFCYILSV
jgi:hypothetical protein